MDWDVEEKGRVGQLSMDSSRREFCAQERKGWSSNWQEKKSLFEDEQYRSTYLHQGNEPWGHGLWAIAH